MKSQHIVIVGGGLSGVSFLVQLIDQLESVWIDSYDASNVTISLIEKQKKIGLGVAYNTPLSSHIMNTRIRLGSVFAQQKNHLFNWLLEQKEHLKFDYPDLEVSAHQYLPRKLYSEYLYDAAQNSMKKAANLGIEISILEGTACLFNQDPFSGTYEIGLQDGRILNATDVILATGDEPPHNFAKLAPHDCYHSSAWPIEEWRNDIAQHEIVGVLGSGLTAIDVWLVLQAQQHSGEVFFISRNGLLPRVQPVHDGSWNLNFLTLDHLQKIRKERALCLQDLIHLMRLEIQKATNEIPTLKTIIGEESTPKDQLAFDLSLARKENFLLMDVIYSSFPLGATIWTMLADSEKEIFLNQFGTHFYRLFSMPVQNAEIIFNALDSGQLKIFSDLEQIKVTPHAFEIYLKTKKLKVDHLINATGQGTDVSKSNNPLLKDLLKKGVIDLHSFGGIRADVNTFEIITSRGQSLPRVHGIGPLIRGELLFTNGGRLNTACAFLLAKRIADRTLLRYLQPQIFTASFLVNSPESYEKKELVCG